ncbi:MAG TPA: hypothetical protein VI753_16335 [Anaerolineales bacterium]|nr:hypothetical protein [Anaerolineales bacterium]
MAITSYDESINYDAAIPYNGAEEAAAEAAGYLLMHAPVRRPPEIDDEDELLAWYFLEVMDD